MPLGTQFTQMYSTHRSPCMAKTVVVDSRIFVTWKVTQAKDGSVHIVTTLTIVNATWKPTKYPARSSVNSAIFKAFYNGGLWENMIFSDFPKGSGS